MNSLLLKMLSDTRPCLMYSFFLGTEQRKIFYTHFCDARIRDGDCRINRERGGGMRERNALPIDYLTHISTSDL